jgi:hypothetical protein
MDQAQAASLDGADALPSTPDTGNARSLDALPPPSPAA